MAKQKVKRCLSCKSLFRARRDAKTCSATCRKRLHRKLQEGLKARVAKMESHVGREFHRLAANLLPNHVVIEPLALHDETGAIQIAEPKQTTDESQHIIRPESGHSGIQTLTQEPAEPTPVAVPPDTSAVEMPESISTETLESPLAEAVSLSSSGNEIISPQRSTNKQKHIDSFNNGDTSTGIEQAKSDNNPYSFTKLVKNNLSRLFSSPPGPSRRSSFGPAALVLLVVFSAMAYLAYQGNKPTQVTLQPVSPPYYRSGGFDINDGYKLSVNVPLEAQNSVILSPTGQPKNLQKGQIFFDQTADELFYYDGTKLIGLNPPAAATINGQTGNITLGSGLNFAGNIISNTGVTSLQNQTGDLNLSTGSGIGINGLTISNKGVLSLKGTANQISVNRSTGSVTLSLPQNIATTSGPTFGGLTVNGTISAQTLTQTTAGSNLNVNAGSDNISFTAGSRVFVFPTSGGAAQTICTTGASCGAGGGVTSLDGLSGALTLANSSGAGTTITIDDTAADGATKGIAAFNSTNFSDNGAGVINTVQNIATTSSPVFVSPNGTTGINTGAGAGTQRIDSSGNLVNIGTITTSGAINGQTISSSANFTGTVAINGASSLSLGTAGPLGSTGSVTFYNSANANTLTLQAGTTSSNLTFTLPTADGSNGQCLKTNGGTTLSFQDCTGGVGGGVTSINSLTGILTLQGTANQVTVSDNGADTITLSLPQDINTTSSPTFAGITITGGAANINVAGTSDTSIGNATGTLTLTGDSLSTIVLNGTTISATELNLLDGHDVALVDTNDAVSTAIIGTGALNSGSITSGFGSINNGSSAITTTGTITGGIVNATTTIQLGGTDINTGGTLSNVAYLDQANTFTNAGTNTFQGAGGITIGDAGLTAGALYLANASNSNLSLLQAAAPSGVGTATYSLPTIAGGSSDDICLVALGNCAGSGTGVTTPGGTPGYIPYFTGAQSIGDSVISQSGSAITVAGTLAVTDASSLSLGTAGPAGSTGAVTFYNSANANTFTLQAGATGGNLTFTLPTADGSNGDCLQTNGGGTLTFTGCTGGAGGGVTSLNGETGVVTLANASGAGGTVTIDDAAADGATKGIATFNSTNFSDNGSGTINTIQDIDSTATPTFAGTILGAAGPAGTTGTAKFYNSASVGSITLTPADPGATDYTLTLPAEDGALCSTGSVCTGYAADSEVTLQNAYDTGNTITTTDARDIDITLANTTTDANFIIDVATGSTGEFQVKNNGTDVLQIGSAGQLQLDVQGSSGGLLLGTDALLYRGGLDLLQTPDALTVGGLLTGSAGLTITGGAANINVAGTSDTSIGNATGTLTLTGNSSSTIVLNGTTISAAELNLLDGHDVALVDTNDAVNTAITGTGALNSGSITSGFGSIALGTDSLQGGSLTVGVLSSLTGQIDFATAGGGAISLQATSTASNFTITLPADDGTVCLTSGNCAGVGGTGDILNNGNSFGAAVTIGTNDNFGLNLEVNNTTVASFSNTGEATFQNSSDSSTAFQIQNSSGDELLNVDSSESNITLLGNNSGETSSWSTDSNSLPATRNCATSVTANGYVYAIGGGCSGTATTVYYAKLNADGSTGSWQTNANTLPAARGWATSVTANGYVYVIGGNESNTPQDTVYYAKLNADGSTGSWQTNANTLPAARACATSVTANGYVYVIGGYIGGNTCFTVGTAQTTVYYAKLNSDGSVGSWQTNANSLPAARACPTSVTANGYVYVMGGSGAGCTASSSQSTVYYAKLNSDGSTASWSTNANALPVATSCATSVTANGYVYVMGGANTASATGCNGATKTGVYYAKLNSSNGSAGSWSTNTNALPAGRACATSVTANGYVYVIAGATGASFGCLSGTSVSTVYYASLARIKVGASLDLVGLQGGTLSNPGDQSLGSTGGSLAAGNGLFIGTLQVQGSASFAQDVSINSTLAANTATFRNTADSTTAFQIQNATGANMLTVSTSGNTITAGSASNVVTISSPGAGSNSEHFGAGSSTSTYTNALAVGKSASVTDDYGTAIGYLATADYHAMAVGGNARATGIGATALGYNTNASYAYSIALGYGTSTTATYQLVIGGNNTEIQNAYIGNGVTNATPTAFALHATGGSGTNIAGADLTLAGGQGTGAAPGGDINFQVALAGGFGSSLNSLQTACLISGTDATFSCPGSGSNSEHFGAGASTSTFTNSLAVGSGASVTGDEGTALGYSANAAEGSTAVGYNSTASGAALGLGSTAIGYNATASGLLSTALGTSASSTNDVSIALGLAATTTADNQLVIGGNYLGVGIGSIQDAYIGSGVTDATPTGFTLHATGGSGTDIAGADLQLAGGQGTGTGAGGDINFQIADPGTTGSSLNALATVFSLSGTDGSALFQNTTDSTTAFQIQNSSGANIMTADTSGNTVTFGSATNVVTISSPGAGSNSEHFGAGSSTGSHVNSLAVGKNATVTGTGGHALGYNASAGIGSVAIGNGAAGSSSQVVAIGQNATASNANAIAIGNNASSTHFDSIAIGQGAATTATNQLVIGANNREIQNAYIGNGVTNASPSNITLNATGGSGTDIAGADISIAGGKGTGAGNGGDINFQVTIPGASGTTLRTLNTVASLSGVNGSALFKNAADSTTAFQVQNAAGTTNVLTIDTSNNEVELDSSGKLLISSDTNLYRSAADTLKTDDGFIVGTLTTGSTAACFNGSNQLATCTGAGANTLQGAYDGGNTITTTDARDIDITLANTTTDANFIIDIATSSTGELQVENNGTDVLQIGSAGQLQLDVQGSSGGLLLGTDALLYRGGADLLQTPDALTVGGLLTGTAGATISGAATSINASSNFATNINTGTSTGAVSIGNGSAGAIAIQSGSTIGITAGTTLSLTSTGANNINITPGGTTNTGVLVKPTTDSTAAFDIQDSSSNSLLTADTSNNDVIYGANIVANGSATLTTDTTSGTGTNTTTVTIVGTAFSNGDVIFIDNAGQDYFTRVTAGGGTSTLTVSPAVTYENGVTVTKYNVQNIGSTTEGEPSANTERFFQGYFSGGVVTGAGSTIYSDGNILFQGDTNLYRSAANTLTSDSALSLTGTQADQVQLTVKGNSGQTADLLDLKDSSGNNLVSVDNNGGIVLQNATDIADAFTVKNAAGTFTVFNIDNTTHNTGIGADADAAAKLYIQSSSYTLLKANAVSTNDLVDLQNNGTSVVTINNTGDTLFQNSTDSTTAFQIKDSSGTSLLTADTSNMYLNVGSGGTPTTKLNVTGVLQGSGSGFSFNIKSTDNAAAAQYVGGGIGFSGNADADRVFGAIQGYHESATASNYAGALRFYTRQSGAASLSQVFNLSSTGAALFQNSSDSATAFQIQDSSSNAMAIFSTNNYSGGANAANAVLKIAQDSGTSRSINAAGTVNASGTDYAEYIPWSGPKPEPGTVIEYKGSAYVVSSQQQASFVGGDVYNEENSIMVAFVGQVRVKVSGSVNTGDLLVDNGDGAARGVAPADAMVEDYLSKIGIAQESGSGTVMAAVGTTAANIAISPQSGSSGSTTTGGSGDFSGINVSGAANVGELTVTGTATIATLHVTGEATFDGNIAVQGDIVLGSSSKVLGNNNTRGEVVVKAGQTSRDYAFPDKYESVPNVVVAPTSDPGGAFWVSDITKDGFTIHLGTAVAADVKFNFQVQQ